MIPGAAGKEDDKDPSLVSPPGAGEPTRSKASTSPQWGQLPALKEAD